MSRLGRRDCGPRRPWRCIVCDAPCKAQRNYCEECRQPSVQQLAAKNATTPTREYRCHLSPETLARLEEWERMERARRMIDGSAL